MRSRALRLWVLCWLTLVWVLLWGNLSAANVIAGLAVALVVTLLLSLPVVPVEGLVHPLSLAKLVAVMIWSLLVSSLQLAWLAIKPGPPPLTAVLRARFDVKSDLVLVLAVNAINLTPGTIAIAIDRDRRIVYVHVIDAGSPRTIDQFHRHVRRLERLLVASFERPQDWKPAHNKEPE